MSVTDNGIDVFRGTMRALIAVSFWLFNVALTVYVGNALLKWAGL